MKNWKTIKPEQLHENVFTAIGTEWMLITAGTLSSWNTMTAAWGGFGFLWQKNVVFAFVRPTRHTYEFTEKNDTFTLSFLKAEHRDILHTRTSRACSNVTE
jgi:flavin reductase (DIM6/NTAB) family NADH-FMN oxidoreductase RutF